MTDHWNRSFLQNLFLLKLGNTINGIELNVFFSIPLLKPFYLNKVFCFIYSFILQIWT